MMVMFVEPQMYPSTSVWEAPKDIAVIPSAFMVLGCIDSSVASALPEQGSQVQGELGEKHDRHFSCIVLRGLYLASKRHQKHMTMC